MSISSKGLPSIEESLKKLSETGLIKPPHHIEFGDPQLLEGGIIEIPIIFTPTSFITIDFTLTPKTKCDCGGEKCGTTHSDWCSIND